MKPANQNTASATALELLVPNSKRRRREQLREVMRFNHCPVRTEEAYRN